MKSCKLCGGPALFGVRLCRPCYRKVHADAQRERRHGDYGDPMEQARIESALSQLCIERGVEPSEDQWVQLCRQARRTSPEDAISEFGGRLCAEGKQS